MDIKKHKNKIIGTVAVALISIYAVFTTPSDGSVSGWIERGKVAIEVFTTEGKAVELCNKIVALKDSEDTPAEPAPVSTETVPVVPLEAPAQ